MRRVRGMALVLLFVTACGGGTGNGGAPTSEATPKAGGTLTYAIESELRTLDPLASTQLVERTVMYQTYESLVTVDPQLNIKPGLATSWTASSDGTTYTFQLKTGVKFHDGTDFNADAVKFNLDRILKAASSPRKSELANLQSVDTQGASTVVLHLKKPDSTLLAQLVDRAGMMLSPAAVQKLGADLGRNPVGAGSGPFKFVEWKRDDHLTLTKNADYYGKKAYLDQIVYKPITNDDARSAGLKTGEFDQIRLAAGKDVASIKADSNLTWKDLPGLAFGGFELNHSKPPFNDKAKAQAVAEAVDRAQVVKNVFFNVSAVSHGPIPPSSWAYDASEKIYDKADPNKAKSIATGFTFTMKVTNTPDNIQEGTLLKDQLAKAGITMNIQPEEFGQLLTEAEAQNFDAALVGWSGRIDPDGNMYSWFHTDGGNNDGKYSNPQVDKALEDARTTTDQAKRKADYDQAQKLLVEDAAYVFINHPVAAQISTNKVHGYVLYPDGMPRFATVWKS
ncbi:MAG TPA: ABC transporter substrate-binding protein [Candidatus Dormibacteraeota bacterium]